MAGPSAVLAGTTNTSTQNNHFKPYLPPSFLRGRTISNLDSRSTKKPEPKPTQKPRRKFKDTTLPSLVKSGDGDTDDEDILGLLDQYNAEGVSTEDLKLWMESAPPDQKLEKARDTQLNPLNVFEARYNTQGISRGDLELWNKRAPPDQKLEAASDTEMDMNEMGMDEMDSGPISRTPKLDFESPQKTAPTETRRGKSHLKNYTVSKPGAETNLGL